MVWVLLCRLPKELVPFVMVHASLSHHNTRAIGAEIEWRPIAWVLRFMPALYFQQTLEFWRYL